MDLRQFIRDVPNFPKEGILFFDITPLLAEPKAFRYAVDAMAERFQDLGASKIVAAEARGFLFGAPLAYKMNLGFVPVRKPGKLPYKTTSVTYDLEYGTDTLSMHEDAVQPGDKVLIIDDLLATGGTAAAAACLVTKMGGVLLEAQFLIELEFLAGRRALSHLPVRTFLKF